MRNSSDVRVCARSKTDFERSKTAQDGKSDLSKTARTKETDRRLIMTVSI